MKTKVILLVTIISFFLAYASHAEAQEVTTTLAPPPAPMPVSTVTTTVSPPLALPPSHPAPALSTYAATVAPETASATSNIAPHASVDIPATTQTVPLSLVAVVSSDAVPTPQAPAISAAPTATAVAIPPAPTSTALAGPIPANALKVTLYTITAQGRGGADGAIAFSDSPDGLQIQTNLRNLPPGPHGFHIHINADCGPADQNGVLTAGMAAGSHYDPDDTFKHLGPMGAGHKGDLPILEVAADGSAIETLSAPHLKVSDLHGHSVIIHQSGDNFSDAPEPNGGGGARISCGTIP